MIERNVEIQNHAGIHCRPSALIINHVTPYAGTVEIEHGGASSDCRQILSLIALDLDAGVQATLRVEGPDEASFADELVELFERHFDFPPRGSGAPSA